MRKLTEFEDNIFTPDLHHVILPFDSINITEEVLEDVHKNESTDLESTPSVLLNDMKSNWTSTDNSSAVKLKEFSFLTAEK